MKKYSLFVSIAIFMFFVYWSFSKPKFDTKNASLYGEVISIMERTRGAGYDIEVKENGNKRRINYAFRNVFDIHVGDSLFKQTDSEILYIKSKADSIIRMANDQGYSITQ